MTEVNHMYTPKPKSKCPDLYVSKLFNSSNKDTCMSKRDLFSASEACLCSNDLMSCGKKCLSTGEVNRHNWASSLENRTTVIPVSGTRMLKSALQLSRKPQSPPTHTPLSKREAGSRVSNFSNEARTSVYTTAESLQSTPQTSASEPHFPNNSKFESTIPKDSMWQE